jgi:hypothetical protein
MTVGGAELTVCLWLSVVVVLLDRASTNSADGVEIRGRWRISTDAPRKAEMMWIVLRKIEAVVSCGTRLLSQP